MPLPNGGEAGYTRGYDSPPPGETTRTPGRAIAPRVPVIRTDGESHCPTCTGDSHACTSHSHVRGSHRPSCTSDSHVRGSCRPACMSDSHACTSHSHTCTARSYVRGNRRPTCASQSHLCAGHSHACAGHSHLRAGHSHLRAGRSHACASHSHLCAGRSHTCAGRSSAGTSRNNTAGLPRKLPYCSAARVAACRSFFFSGSRKAALAGGGDPRRLQNLVQSVARELPIPLQGAGEHVSGAVEEWRGRGGGRPPRRVGGRLWKVTLRGRTSGMPPPPSIGDTRKLSPTRHSACRLFTPAPARRSLRAPGRAWPRLRCRRRRAASWSAWRPPPGTAGGSQAGSRRR